MKLALFLVLTAIFSCNGRTQYISKDTLIEDSVIYGFVNSVLTDKNITELGNCNNLSVTSLKQFTRNDSLSLVARDSLFTPKDILFIYEQLEHSKKFMLNPKYIPTKVLLSEDTLISLRESLDQNGTSVNTFWNNYRHKYGSSGFCSITMPLFSKNRTIAFVKFGYYCGSLCGGGGTYIFQLKKGKWVLIEILEGWIS